MNKPVFEDYQTGNIVKCKKSNDAAYYCITATDALYRKVRLSGARATEWHTEENIKPVKLTDETIRGILGMTDSHIVPGAYEDAERCDFILKKMQGLDGYTIDGLMDAFVAIPAIQYVHQVQNWFYQVEQRQIVRELNF